MKSIKEIEKMGLEELLAVSSDETVKVPAGFMERVESDFQELETIESLAGGEAAVDYLSEGYAHHRRRRIGFISAAAAVTLLAGIGFGFIINDRPRDTFDDPRLAYAELEKAFATISETINRGVGMAEDSQRIIERTKTVFE